MNCAWTNQDIQLVENQPKRLLPFPRRLILYRRILFEPIREGFGQMRQDHTEGRIQ